MRSCIRFTPLARRLLKFHEPHIPCYVVCTGDLLILSSSFAKNSICFMRLMKPVAEIMSANVLISHLKPFNKPHFHGLKLKQDITPVQFNVKWCLHLYQIILRNIYGKVFIFHISIRHGHFCFYPPGTPHGHPSNC